MSLVEVAVESFELFDSVEEGFSEEGVVDGLDVEPLKLEQVRDCERLFVPAKHVFLKVVPFQAPVKVHKGVGLWWLRRAEQKLSFQGRLPRHRRAQQGESTRGTRADGRHTLAQFERILSLLPFQLVEGSEAGDRFQIHQLFEKLPGVFLYPLYQLRVLRSLCHEPGDGLQEDYVGS